MKLSWKSLIELYNLSNENIYLQLDSNNLHENNIVFPSYQSIFRCFEYFDISETRVVIIGQDPYHGDNQATGLAFGVDNGITIPPSLRNIKKELMSDLNIVLQDNSLESWAKQGVLLLNSSLTVIRGKPGSQIKLWRKFTDFIIQKISSECQNVVFVAWGAFAYDKIIRNVNFEQLGIDKDLFIVSSHPSPLSVMKPLGKFTSFSGSKPFSRINILLDKYKKIQIDW